MNRACIALVAAAAALAAGCGENRNKKPAPAPAAPPPAASTQPPPRPAQRTDDGFATIVPSSGEGPGVIVPSAPSGGPGGGASAPPPRLTPGDGTVRNAPITLPPPAVAPEREVAAGSLPDAFWDQDTPAVRMIHARIAKGEISAPPGYRKPRYPTGGSAGGGTGTAASGGTGGPGYGATGGGTSGGAPGGTGVAGAPGTGGSANTAPTARTGGSGTVSGRPVGIK